MDINVIVCALPCVLGSIAFGYASDVDKAIFITLTKNHGGIENCTFFPAVPRLISNDWLNKPGQHNTYELICEAAWDDGAMFEVMPRYKARRQLELLQQEFGYQLRSAFECEFLSLNADTLQPDWSSKDYCSHANMNHSIDWLYQVDKHVRANGVNIRTMHTEYSEGQFEVTMMPECGMKTADDIYIFKQAIKAIAKQHGKVVSFMTRIFKEGASNGQHFNHSLWNEAGESVLWDSSKPDKLSDVGRYWLGGILKHLCAITSLCCPTINCYRRLHQMLTPNRVNWGVDQRNMSVRLVNDSAASMRIENRLPSSACNPYLVLAGVLAAGIDGLRNKIEPPPAGENKDDQVLPHTLEEALAELEADDVIKAALGEEFVTAFVGLKRKIEVKKFKGHDMKKFIEDEVKAERNDYLINC